MAESADVYDRDGGAPEASSIGAGSIVATSPARWKRTCFCWGALILALFASLVLGSDDAGARRRAHVFRRHSFPHPASAMVVDGRTGKTLYTHNIDAPRHPASLTKIMTLYLLFEQLRAGKMTMSTELKVSERAADQAPSKLELQAGETISVKDAIRALVTKSANDVAVVVAENVGGSEAAFARAMTDKARALGMSRTIFRNASGLPNDEQTTTSRDLITLAQHTLKEFPEYSKVFQTRFFQYKGHIHRNHNGLLFSYPGTEGMKTGYTQAAGFNLVITARRGGKHLIAVVLGGESVFSRNQAMREMLDAAWPSASAGGKPVEPVIASAAASPALATTAAPIAAQIQAEPGAVEDAASETPEIPEPNPAFHSTPEELRLQAQILAAINGPQGAGGGRRGGLPITAVLAGATSNAPVPADPPVEVPAEQPQPAENAASSGAEPATTEEPAPPQGLAQQSAIAQASATAQTPAPAMPDRGMQIAAAWSQQAEPKGGMDAKGETPAEPQAAPARSVEQSPAPVAAVEAAPPPAQPLGAAQPAQAEALSRTLLPSETPAGAAPTATPVQVAAATPAAPAAPAAPKTPAPPGPYHVQVGSYGDAASAQSRLTEVLAAAGKVVKGHPSYTATAQISGKDVFRARYGKFSEKEAETACSFIKKHKFDCLVVRSD